MKKLIIAALLVSGLAQAENKSTETVFNKFLVQGKFSEANMTLVTTQNPEMALMVMGTDSRTMDRISRGRLMCTETPSQNKAKIQGTALAFNANISQVEQALAMGLKMNDVQSRSHSDMKVLIKFVNAAGDAPYYNCN